MNTQHREPRVFDQPMWLRWGLNKGVPVSCRHSQAEAAPVRAALCAFKPKVYTAYSSAVVFTRDLEHRAGRTSSLLG